MRTELGLWGLLGCFDAFHSSMQYSAWKNMWFKKSTIYSFNYKYLEITCNNCEICWCLCCFVHSGLASARMLPSEPSPLLQSCPFHQLFGSARLGPKLTNTQRTQRFDSWLRDQCETDSTEYSWTMEFIHFNKLSWKMLNVEQFENGEQKQTIQESITVLSHIKSCRKGCDYHISISGFTGFVQFMKTFLLRCWWVQVFIAGGDLCTRWDTDGFKKNLGSVAQVACKQRVCSVCRKKCDTQKCDCRRQFMVALLLSRGMLKSY